MTVLGNHRIKWTLSIGLLAIIIFGIAVAPGFTAIPTATPFDGAGYQGPSIPSGIDQTGEVTAEKPESKLWYHDGSWWGSMWSQSGNAYHIHKLDWDTQNWLDTGVELDDRKKSRADVLSDGNTLYVVSHLFSLSGGASSAGERGELFRYTYSNGTYSLDSGFPVEVNQAESKSLTIAKDSNDVLWITWLQNDLIMLNHSDASGGGDTDWATPFELPGSENSASSQDISAVIAFDGHIGVMWSEQKGSPSMLFAAHADDDPVNNWTISTVFGVSGDDHINLKTLQSDSAGKLFAVVKTSLNASLIDLLVCDGGATSCTAANDWTAYKIYDETYSPTRPLLLLDTTNRDIYIFSRIKLPSNNNKEMIYFKKADMDAISFDDGPGEPFIDSSEYFRFNNPTSTKQNVDHKSGIVVLAADDSHRVYGHNCIDLGAIESDICLTTDLGAEVKFASATYTVSETGAPNQDVVLELSNTVPTTVTVDVAITGDTATLGQDFNATSGTVSFPPNTLSQTLTIAIVDDALDELAETADLTLSNGFGLALQEPSTAVLTITDDDNPPSVSLTSDSFAVAETVGSQPITMTLSGPSGQPVSVKLATKAGTATAGSDFTAVSQTVTFAPGETTKTVNIPIVDNETEEPIESFSVTMSSPVNVTLGAISSATITIQDNDALPFISFAAADYLLDEGVGTFFIPVELIGLTDSIVTVDVVASSSDATSGLDYAPISTTLTFPPGSTVQNIGFTIVDDSLDESDEVVTLTLSNFSKGDPGLILETEVTIDDNDSPPLVSFSSSDYVADESDGTAAITVLLNNPSERTASVDYAVTAGTAVPGDDFVPMTGTLEFPAGTLTQTFTVELVDNDLFEFEETVTLTLTNTKKSDLGTPSVAILTITDSDGLPKLSFESAEIEVLESAGKVSLPVEMTEEVGVTASVIYTTKDGTASAGSDYSGQNRPLFIAAGDTKGQIDIPLFDDLQIEHDETFRVELSSPTNVALGATRVVTVTIIDDDAPRVSFTETAVSIGEGHGSLSVDVVLSETTPFTATVDYAGQSETAVIDEDFTLISGTLTFAPGTLTQTLTIPIINDIMDEPNEETFGVRLFDPTNLQIGAGGTLSVTISDNDKKPTVSLSQATYQAEEDAGEVEITIVLSNPSSQQVRITLATVDDTAIAGEDYTAVWERVRFSPGELVETVTIPLLSDDLEEGNETIALILGDPDEADLGAIRNGTVTILDSDILRPGAHKIYLSMARRGG